MQALPDPNWIAVILEAAVIVFSCIGWAIRKITGLSKRKQITSNLRFANALQLSKDIRGRVTIAFGNQFQAIAHNVYSIILDVKNTGGKKIALTDYQPGTRIELELGVDSEILEAEVTRSPRGAKGVSITPLKSGFTIPPLMLERRESLTVKMLVTGSKFHIEESIHLQEGTEHILRVEPLSRFNIRNHSITAAILCFLQFCLFYFISYAILGAWVNPLPTDIDQAAGFSLIAGSLIAVLLSIAIIFVVFDSKPLRISTREPTFMISKRKQFFVIRNLLTTALLLVISPCSFYFINIFILYNAFNLNFKDSPLTSYSFLLGGVITTLLIVVFNWLLSWLLPLREFVVD